MSKLKEFIAVFFAILLIFAIIGVLITLVLLTIFLIQHVSIWYWLLVPVWLAAIIAFGWIVE